MMTDMMGGGMWIAGVVGLLLVVVLILAAAALVKYLRAGKRQEDGRDD
jgi:predicted PurR-regulated permease PerM